MVAGVDSSSGAADAEGRAGANADGKSRQEARQRRRRGKMLPQNGKEAVVKNESSRDEEYSPGPKGRFDGRVDEEGLRKESVGREGEKKISGSRISHRADEQAGA